MRKYSITRLRPGFTVLEVVAAFSALIVAMILVAQVGLWATLERSERRNQQAAEELAANILESARASAWEELTPAWASAQRLPDTAEYTPWLLQVRVEPEAGRDLVKRVTVEVHYALEGAYRKPHVELVGWFGPRSVPAAGGKP